MSTYYDVVAIGSSPKIIMKLSSYAKENKTILIIDESKELGGNWKVTNFSNCTNVELGCFLIPYNKESYDFLKKDMGIPMKKLEYQPAIYYKNKLQIVETGLFIKILALKKQKTIMNLLRLIKTYIKNYKKRKEKVEYFENGIQTFHKYIQTFINQYNVDVENKKATNIYVDFDKNDVEIKLENEQTIKTKKLLLGTGIDIEEIQSSKYNLNISKNSFIFNQFSFVLLKIKTKQKAKFSYIDLSLHPENKISQKSFSKIDLTQDCKNFNKTYTLVWRASNITDYADNINSDEVLIAIDTNSWYPKSSYENDMAEEIYTFLKNYSFIDSKSELLDYKWNLIESKSIGPLEKTISKYFFPFIETTNSLVLTKDPR